jgi:hypothetical protein
MNNNVHTDNSLRPICVSPSVCAEGQHDFAGETKIDASDTFSSPDTRASLDYIPALPLSSSKRSREESVGIVSTISTCIHVLAYASCH